MDTISSETQNVEQHNLPCYHCNKVFTSKLKLDSHLQYINSYRIHECTISGCNSIFSSRSHLTAHLAVHNGTRKYACDVPGCLYRARIASQLVQHQATHGLGYVYACNYCEYQATTSSNLRRHVRLHLNTRPYLCPHCESQFVELSALRRHVLDSAHHPGLPLYVCPWCRQRPSPPASSSLVLVMTSPIMKVEENEVVGFNSSNLAWRHLVQTHAEELTRPETMQRLGRKPGETLIERDVSLIFGLYDPGEDAKLQLPLTVRQEPAIRIRRGRGNLTQVKLGKLNNNGNKNLLYSQALPPLATSLFTLTETSTSDLPRFMGLQQVQVQLHQSPPSHNDDLPESPTSPKSGYDGPLVGLPGGAIWSLSSLKAALYRQDTPSA